MTCCAFKLSTPTSDARPGCSAKQIGPAFSAPGLSMNCILADSCFSCTHAHRLAWLGQVTLGSLPYMCMAVVLLTAYFSIKGHNLLKVVKGKVVKRKR